jgi:hypothetical protein
MLCALTTNAWEHVIAIRTLHYSIVHLSCPDATQLYYHQQDEQL